MYRYIKARFRRFLGVGALVVIATAALNGGNVVTQRLIDAVMAQDLPVVRLYIVLAIGYSLFSAAVYVVCAVCRDVFNASLMNDLRLSVFDGILRRSRRDFTAHHSADYVSALTNDVNAIHGQYFGMLFLGILSVASMVFSAALMAYYQPLVALCAVLGAFLMTAAPSALGRVLGRWQKQRSERRAALTTMLAECFAGFEIITAFGIQGHIRRRFRECSGALRDCEYRTEGYSALSDSLSQFLSGLAQTSILALSCWMVFTGRMSVGALVVFISLNSTFCSALSAYLLVSPMLKGVRPVIERVNGYAEYVCTDRQGDAVPTFRNDVTVRDLSFAYRDSAPILRHLSLTLKRGGKYALTGESGCGKSTLLRLLTGGETDYQGGIFYDGTELREIKREQLHQVVAYIHQDVFLFDDTIRNNICLFEAFSEDRFAWAVKTSGVQKFIESVPEGADYPVGENGERLSGGQKQRVAIARALIRNTKFLILDEGTSALDEQTALEIERELLRLEDLTLLTVTHHLKEPQAYDAVFSLQNGAIAPSRANLGELPQAFRAEGF